MEPIRVLPGTKKCFLSYGDSGITLLGSTVEIQEYLLMYICMFSRRQTTIDLNL
jgi:hypothetical protein